MTRLLPHRSGELVRTFEGHARWVTSVVWSPDAKRILTGSRDKTARIHSTETGELGWTRSSSTMLRALRAVSRTHMARVKPVTPAPTISAGCKRGPVVCEGGWARLEGERRVGERE